MAKIKVPWRKDPVEVSLHDPIESEVPWFVAVGTRVEMTPEQVAEEMADAESDWDFSHFNESSSPHTPEEADAMKAETFVFAQALRKAKAARKGVGAGGRERGGRINDTCFSVADDIAVIATHYVRTGVKRQAAIDAAADYWIDGKQKRKQPAKRLIDASMARIRRGGVVKLGLSIAAVRVKYRLPTLPTLFPKVRRNTRTK